MGPERDVADGVRGLSARTACATRQAGPRGCCDRRRQITRCHTSRTREPWTTPGSLDFEYEKEELRHRQIGRGRHHRQRFRRAALGARRAHAARDVASTRPISRQLRVSRWNDTRGDLIPGLRLHWVDCGTQGSPGGVGGRRARVERYGRLPSTMVHRGPVSRSAAPPAQHDLGGSSGRGTSARMHMHSRGGRFRYVTANVRRGATGGATSTGTRSRPGIESGSVTRTSA